MKQDIIRGVYRHRSIQLPANILEILFENSYLISKVLRNLIGLYGVDHIALTIIDPKNEIIIFSSKKHIEYHLISLNLWRYDYEFYINSCQELSPIWWDAYNDDPNYLKVKDIKYKDNFSLGFTIVKKLDNFCFLYSFATKSKIQDLRSYYMDNTLRLINVGNYFYKSMRNIYAKYCLPINPPEVGNLASLTCFDKQKPYLHLIDNNVRC